MRTKPKLLFHIECFWGIGHAVRAIRIASELCKDFDCFIVSGSEVLEKFKMNPRINLTRLPTLYYNSDTDSIHAKEIPLNEALRKRELLILKAFLEIKPDVLLIEMFPFGRLSISEEILMMTELCFRHSMPIFLTLRDIQVYPHDEKLKNKYSYIANKFIATYSPQILVHSDSRVLSHNYIIPREIFDIKEDFVHQTGYVGRAYVDMPCPGAKKLVVAFGGGRSANKIISKFLVSIKQEMCDDDVEFWGMQEEKASGVVNFNGERAFASMNNVGALVITGGYNS